MHAMELNEIQYECVLFCSLCFSPIFLFATRLFFHLFKHKDIRPLLSFAYWKVNNVQEKQTETICFTHTHNSLFSECFLLIGKPQVVCTFHCQLFFSIIVLVLVLVIFIYISYIFYCTDSDCM